MPASEKPAGVVSSPTAVQDTATHTVTLITRGKLIAGNDPHHAED